MNIINGNQQGSLPYTFNGANALFFVQITPYHYLLSQVTAENYQLFGCA